MNQQFFKDNFKNNFGIIEMNDTTFDIFCNSGKYSRAFLTGSWPINIYETIFEVNFDHNIPNNFVRLSCVNGAGHLFLISEIIKIMEENAS